MKVVTVALAALLLAPQEDEPAKKAARIDRAIGWVLNEDADVREMGRKELLEIGADAIPAIERKAAEKGCADLIQVLRRLDHAPRVEAWVAEQELAPIDADEEFRKAAEKLPRDVAEKYLYVKYQEALAHVRHKNYQRAFDMASGLIALDAKSAHIDAFKRLRRHCENMITQTTLVQAQVIQPKVWFVEGEPIELSVRMKNMYKAMINLAWEKPAPPETAGGSLLLDVDLTMSDMAGTSISDQRHQEVRFEDEVPIAPGAQWERKFTLDTTTSIPVLKQILVVKVGGWTQPVKMSTDGVNITRRIQFEPATLRILPKQYARFLDNPLDSLEKMIAEGDPQEIFVCSQLLEGPDKDRGTQMLIQLLARSNTLISKTTAANILVQLTGQSLGTDPRRWENWFQNKSAEPKDKKKK